MKGKLLVSHISTALICLALISGCSAKTVQIYEAKGDKQCQGGGLSLEESQAKLTNAEIDVIRSDCGIKTGMSVMSMCGAPTLKIILHEITENDAEAASALGFEKADSLVNQERGTGFQVTACP